MWDTDLVAQWCMGSSWTRDGTRVLCTGRWILNHETTREAQVCGSSSCLDKVSVSGCPSRPPVLWDEGDEDLPRAAGLIRTPPTTGAGG